MLVHCIRKPHIYYRIKINRTLVTLDKIFLCRNELTTQNDMLPC